jgi:hypothetical protein
VTQATSPQTRQEPYSCSHPRVSKPRARAVANGKVQMTRQCLDCGARIGEQVSKLTALQEWGVQPVEVFDEQALKAYRDRITRYWQERYEERERTFEEEREARKKSYREYLDSPRWEAKRKRVLRRCRHVCEGCQQWPATHVHHLTYTNIGDELLYQLVGLCHNCHEKAHKARFNNDGRS